MTDHDDERFTMRLKEWAADYQAPPETPREAMWQGIARERRARRARPSVMVRLRWGVGLAATLALGIALGRMSQSEVAPDGVAGVPGDEVEVSNVAFERMTREHMGRVETFLNVFRSEARAGRMDSTMGGVARALAAQNRLLLGSPAASDASVRRLLNDVDLVLMQIQQYGATGSANDLDFINDGIQRRGVLLQLRTVSTQGAT
ncbi:MAG: hypothetical protein WD934_00445 [Gemmatimonadales bacterium]